MKGRINSNVDQNGAIKNLKKKYSIHFFPVMLKLIESRWTWVNEKQVKLPD